MIGAKEWEHCFQRRGTRTEAGQERAQFSQRQHALELGVHAPAGPRFLVLLNVRKGHVRALLDFNLRCVEGEDGAADTVHSETRVACAFRAATYRVQEVLQH